VSHLFRVNGERRGHNRYKTFWLRHPSSVVSDEQVERVRVDTSVFSIGECYESTREWLATAIGGVLF
jgi:hypothetical protein